MSRKYTNEDFFQVLGKISVFFATADILTNIMIVGLVKNENYGELEPLSDKTTLNQKFRWLKKLRDCDVTNKDLLKNINLFIDMAIDVSDERNRYIHDQWIFREGEISKGKIERRKVIGIKKQLVVIQEKVHLSIEDLYVFLEKIGKLQEQIGEVNRALGFVS